MAEATPAKAKSNHCIQCGFSFEPGQRLHVSSEMGTFHQTCWQFHQACWNEEQGKASVTITEADVWRAVGELFMTGERQTEWLAHEDLEGNLVNSMSKDEVTARLCDLLGLKETPCP